MVAESAGTSGTQPAKGSGRRLVGRNQAPAGPKRWWRRRPRRRFGRLRALKALLFLPGSLSILVGFAVFVAFVGLGAVVLRLDYHDPGSGAPMDAFEAFYLAMSLVVVSPVAPLPDDWPSRLVFILIPLGGLLLFGQFLVRLVATALDRSRWESAVASTYSDHVIVCGLGRVGFRVVRWLLDLGEDVVVVDLPEDPDQLHDQVRSWGVPVVAADARRTEVLRQAGVERCSAVIPITDDDLVNLMVATGARSLNPDVRVVLRTFEDRLAHNLQGGFDIYRAYSTSALAAPAFAAAATHAPVDYAFAYGEEHGHRTLMTITKFTVVHGSLLVGRTIGDVEDLAGVQVIAHRRSRFVQHPALDTVLEPGDGFVVSAGPEALDLLATYTPPTRELGRYEQGRWPIRTAAAEGP